MLRIFRINDPYRLILVFFIIILVKLPVLLNGDLISTPEIKYQVIGEKLADGALLYVDIWDNIAPLSAIFYEWIYKIFGRSYTSYHILAIIVFFFQAALFNTILIRKKVYNENSYLPALFYAVFGFLFFDITSLSPQLLGLTMIIFSLDSLFNHLELRRKNDKNLINIGIYLGIAALFYLPFIVYLPAMTFGLILFTNTITRRYFLMIYGTFFVFMLVWMVYFIIGEPSLLINNLFLSLFHFDYTNYFNIKSILLIASIPAVYLLLGIFKTFQAFGYTNYQVRIQSLFFLFFLFQIAAWILWSQKSGASLVVFAPTFSFFMTHYFTLMRKRLWREISFYLLVIILVFVNFQSIFGEKLLARYISTDRLIADLNKAQEKSINKNKVLVIGHDLSYYYQNSLATPYLNWMLAKRHLNDVENYDNILEIYENFDSDMPDFIIDEESVWPKIKKIIPDLGDDYVKVSNGIYKRVSN